MSLQPGKILSSTELERYRIRTERNLPAKGKKEFAPTFSWVECKLVEAARDERHALLKEERVERVGALSVAEWDEKENIAVVTYTVGRNWEFFGHQRGETKCLHPEEALFLLEASNLLLLYNNVGLSVQQGYNTLLGKQTGCSLACYRVFSHLARQGFRLKRHGGPLYVLTDYERRIGLESYLYPSKHNTGNLHNSHNNSSLGSTAANYQQNLEDGAINPTVGSEEISTVVKCENLAASSVVKSENLEACTVVKSENIDSSITVKRENTETSPLGQDKLIVPLPSASDNGALSHVKQNEATATVKTEILSIPQSQKQPSVSELNYASVAPTLKQLDARNRTREPQLHGMVTDTSEKSQFNLLTDTKKEHEESEEVIVCSNELLDKAKINLKREENVCEITYERLAEMYIRESNASNVINSCQSTVPIVDNCDNINSNAVIKTENSVEKEVVKFEDNNSFIDIVSVEDSTDNRIKKEISIDSTDFCEIVGSVEQTQYSNEGCDKRIAERKSMKHITVATMAGDNAKHEWAERSLPSSSVNSCAPIVDLTNSSNTNLQYFQRKVQSYGVPTITDNLSRNASESTVNVCDSSHNTILKCEVDSTGISSIDDSSEVPEDISNSLDSNIFCVTRKEKRGRKRRILNKNEHRKNKKSCVVDVDIDAFIRPNKKLGPEKISKQEHNTDNDEIIVIDDNDLIIVDDIVIDNSNSSCKNETLVEIKDEQLEKELSKFYEEITLIDLTDEDSRLETRNEILDSFPNYAGAHIAIIKAPPSNLLPENVSPSQQEYHIKFRNLNANRAHLPARRYFQRGRDSHRRFKFRGRHFRRPHYRRSARNHMPHDRIQDERMCGRQQNSSREFSSHYGMDHEGQRALHSYGNTFDTQSEDHMPLAMIDTTGDYIPTQRFEHQHRFPLGAPNNQWYERTFIPSMRNESFDHHADSPSTPALHYEHIADNNRRERADNYQRHNRRHMRSTNYRGNRGGMSRPRNSYGGSPARPAVLQKDTLRYSWQKLQNVVPNVESWSELKMVVSGRNLQNGYIKRDCDAPINSEDSESEEMELSMEQADEEMEEDEWKPLIEPADCSDIGSILTKLRIFKEVHCDPGQIASLEARLRINYDIYLPTTKFKKSSPCVPDYRLCIIESEDEVPSAGEISVLVKELQDDVPLLFAIVVPDSVAFYHFANISLPVDDSFSM